MRISATISKQNLITVGKTLENLRMQLNEQCKLFKPKSVNMPMFCHLYNIQKLHLMFADKAHKFQNMPANKMIKLSIDINQLTTLDVVFIDDNHPAYESIVTRQLINVLKQNFA